MIDYRKGQVVRSISEEFSAYVPEDALFLVEKVIFRPSGKVERLRLKPLSKPWKDAELNIAHAQWQTLEYIALGWINGESNIPLFHPV
jgi:hypothetical protein